MFSIPITLDISSPALDCIAESFKDFSEAVVKAVEIYSHLNGWGVPPSPTEGFSVEVLGEVEMGFALKATLPQLPAGSPASKNYADGGEVQWALNGVAQDPIMTVRDQETLEDPAFKGQLGDTVAASFRFKDASGNFSPDPLILPEFILSDTVPPPDAVEGFGVTVGDEVADV